MRYGFLQETWLNDESGRLDDGFEDVGPAAALADGSMRGVDVAGERVLLAHAGGCVYAVAGLCTHQIAHLEDGELEPGERMVRCPRHGAGFDLATGEPLHAPADVPLDVHEVRVVAGRLLVSRRPRR
jgi:3-phenylpropionate/trans-cinnamate dioxygenase ferredoxin subunit